MRLPSKMRGLQQLDEWGLPTPRTLFLREEDLSQERFLPMLARFLDVCSEDRFMIRSCVDVEDGSEQSMAGQFFSSGPVTRADLTDQIPLWGRKNRQELDRRSQSGKAHLMVQPYVEAAWGGVAFVPWSWSPLQVLMEATRGGAGSAVEGRDAERSLLTLRDDLPDVYPLPTDLAAARTSFLEAFAVVRAHCDRAQDLEWLVTTEGRLVLLQMRPVTRPVHAVIQATAAQETAVREQLTSVQKGRWDIGGLGESLGVLSPLSASLYRTLFQDIRPALHRLGFQGGPSYFHRAPNGRIYRHAGLEARFFRFRPLGSFRFGLHEAEWRRRAAQWEHEEGEADYERLLNVFTLWQIASLYFLHREKGRVTEAPFTCPGEYELGQLTDVAPPGDPERFLCWEKCRNRLKRGFLSELRKWKQHIVRSPDVLFLDWETYVQGFSEAGHKITDETIRRHLTPEMLLSLPDSFGGKVSAPGAKGVRIAGKGRVQAPVLVIPEPDRWTDPLLPGSLLVAPYFRNDWIPDLPGLAGVVLEQGGALSHSAILAREQEIPYLIGMHGAVESARAHSSLLLDLDRARLIPS